MPRFGQMRAYEVREQAEALDECEAGGRKRPQVLDHQVEPFPSKPRKRLHIVTGSRSTHRSSMLIRRKWSSRGASTALSRAEWTPIVASLL
jgi:hypothetical protein